MLMPTAAAHFWGVSNPGVNRNLNEVTDKQEFENEK